MPTDEKLSLGTGAGVTDLSSDKSAETVDTRSPQGNQLSADIRDGTLDTPLGLSPTDPAVAVPTGIVPTGGVGQISTAFVKAGSATGCEIVVLGQAVDMNGVTVFRPVKKGYFTATPGVVTLVAGTYRVRVRNYTVEGPTARLGRFAADSGNVVVT